MFYKKRIEALEARVETLEIKVAQLIEKARVQGNEVDLLWAQLAGLEAQNPLPEPKPTPKPRRRRRKTNGKEANTTNE